MAGTDTPIWALNEADSFVGYHARDNRGKLLVDWSNGVASPPPPAPPLPSLPPPALPSPSPPPAVSALTLSPGAVAGIVGGAAAVGAALTALLATLVCLCKAKAATGKANEPAFIDVTSAKAEGVGTRTA